MQLKECINDLKSKLYTEVQNYENLKLELEDLKGKKDILKEIINIIKNENIEELNNNTFQLGLLLPIVYGNIEANSIYDKIISHRYSNDKDINNNKSILLLQTKFKEDLEFFSNKIQLLEKQIFMKKSTNIEYRRILSNYKYSGLITSLQVELITKFMQHYDYEPKDQIRIFESIRIHNTKVKYENSKISYTVVNMLDDNYEKYDIDQLEENQFKDKFQTVIASFYRSVKMDDSVEDVIELMPELESGNYSFDEFDYIYKSVINRLIDDLLESINSISEPTIYKDIELRKVVIQEYNENKQKLNKLKYSYNSKRSAYCTKIKQQKELENIDEKVINNIFYKLTSNGETSYLERDIKDFPEEYLLKIKELIEKKKYDKLSPDMDKSFNSIHRQMKEYKELRDDQVRIVYKHLSSNNYLIVGAFVKKSDNDRMMYGNIASRSNNIDISTPELLNEQLENSKKIEERLFSFIDEKARKGSR